VRKEEEKKKKEREKGVGGPLLGEGLSVIRKKGYNGTTKLLNPYLRGKLACSLKVDILRREGMRRGPWKLNFLSLNIYTE